MRYWIANKQKRPKKLVNALLLHTKSQKFPSKIGSFGECEGWTHSIKERDNIIQQLMSKSNRMPWRWGFLRIPEHCLAAFDIAGERLPWCFLSCKRNNPRIIVRVLHPKASWNGFPVQLARDGNNLTLHKMSKSTPEAAIPNPIWSSQISRTKLFNQSHDHDNNRILAYFCFGGFHELFTTGKRKILRLIRKIEFLILFSKVESEIGATALIKGTNQILGNAGYELGCLPAELYFRRFRNQAKKGRISKFSPVGFTMGVPFPPTAKTVWSCQNNRSVMRIYQSWFNSRKIHSSQSDGGNLLHKSNASIIFS